MSDSCDPMNCSLPGSSVHGILQARKLEWVVISFSKSCLVMSNSLQPHGLYCSWNSSGQNTVVSSLSLLQGIFPTLESNPGLLHCRRILHQLSYKGSPRILEWVAYSFSSVSSWLRNRVGVSLISGRFFTNWVIREAPTVHVQFSSVTQSCPTLCDPMDCQHARLPCPSTTQGAYSYSCPLSQWFHSTISSSVTPSTCCPQSFPTSGSFPMIWLFVSSG